MWVRFLVVLSLLFSHIAIAQLTEFSTDPSKFVGQMEKHLASFDRKDAKEFTEKLELVWGNIDASDKSRMIALSNAMAQKKFRPYPEFKAYWLSCYELLAGIKTDPQKFQVWQGILEKLIQNKQKARFEEFLIGSTGMITGGVIFQSNVVEWRVKGGDFSFQLDDKNKGLIYISNTRLTCYASEDSTVVDGTSGTFDPSVNTFFANGGKVYWTRAGLPESETYAELGSFKINTKSSSFKADSAVLHTPYFKDPLLGSFDEKVVKITRGGGVNFPKFVSRNQNHQIKDVVPGVDYIGGFTLEGAEFIGNGRQGTPARMMFYNQDNNPFAVVRSGVFSINETKISGMPVSAVFYIGEDSIAHPYNRLEYIIKDQTMTLTRPQEALGGSPFTNSYHNLDMYFESLYWTMGDTLLNFGSLFGSSVTEARFQSIHFIDQQEYARMQSLSGSHPAEQLAAYANKYDVLEFDAAKLSTGLMITLEDAKPMYYQLANLGLIDFDQAASRIRINDKLFLYVEGLKGKKDHDAIQFLSDIKNASGEKYNAYLNIKTKDMRIAGLKRVILSDPQFVRLYPDSTNAVMVHRDRDMTFGGIVAAGATEYFGSKFTFDYEKFEINLVECDSMRIRVWPFEEGRKGQVRLSSVLEGIRGKISIDDPSNKSGGNAKFHNYPKVSVSKETFVYYDKIYKGVYNRNDFMFIIAPFELDSLDNFSRDHLVFDGILKSAGIFPDFSEKLKVMPDYSLGFIRDVSKTGVEMYKDKSMFKNSMMLTSRGLQGDGKIEFLTSTAESSAFTFFPDSTAGIAQTYENIQATAPKKVPDVKGENVYVKYVPADKLFVAKSEEKPLAFFNQEASLKGRLFLTPEGMTGRGRMRFANATLNARRFSYSNEKILSDTAAFDLTSQDLSSLAFRTDNVSADVDFKQRMGKFKANGENTFIEFPDNQYIAFMDEFKWYMDVDDIELVKKTSLTIESSEFEKPNFYSIHPKQDSLSFMAPFARFNVNTKDINCTKVPYMDVADARIVPDSGKVIIHKKAKMETLKNAQILANNITKNHLIVNATVNVLAKREYEAEGDYFYKDENEEAFKIHFARIKPDTAYQTFARGKIRQDENFRLSPNFEFYGDVELAASNQFLVFDGATRIAHNCERISRNWMNFRAEINPLEIYIPVGEDLKDLDGEPIGAGVIWSVDSVGMYSTFLSRKGSPNDINVMTASGFLYYDKGAKEYRISNSEKLKELSLPGNYISMHTDLCLVSGDGAIHIDEGLGQVELNTIGSLNYNMGSNEISLRGAMGIEFPFIDNAIERMAKRMKEAQGIDPLDISRTFYKKALNELVGQEEADRIESDIVLKGEIKGKIPELLFNPLFIGDIRLNWNEEEGAFMNDGKIGIINANKEQVFKYFNGYVMVRPQRGAGKEKVRNSISIYIEVDEKNWYFFEYSLGTLDVQSSDAEFIKVIAETKDDDLKFKGTKGVSDLIVRVSSDKSKVSRLKRNFED